MFKCAYQIKSKRQSARHLEINIALVIAMTSRTTPPQCATLWHQVHCCVHLSVECRILFNTSVKQHMRAYIHIGLNKHIGSKCFRSSSSDIRVFMHKHVSTVSGADAHLSASVCIDSKIFDAIHQRQHVEMPIYDTQAERKYAAAFSRLFGRPVIVYSHRRRGRRFRQSTTHVAEK